MTQKNSFATQTAITITRVFGTMGLTLGLLLGVLGIQQPAAAQPIALGDAALLTPVAVGDNLEPATSEGFTKVGFKGHRGVRRRHFKGGHGFKGHRFGGHGFGHHFRQLYFYGHANYYGSRSYYGHQYYYPPYYITPYWRGYAQPRGQYVLPQVRYDQPQVDYQRQPAPTPAPLPPGCRMTREYQTRVAVGGKYVDAYGDACLQADGSWKRGPAKIVPN